MSVNSKDVLISQQLLNASVNKRTWGDILYNVKVYGAAGDGVTDDTAAIQKAFDACPNGGTVYFPSGVYLVSSSINIPTNGVTVDGSPQGSTITSNSATENIFTFGDGVTRINNIVVRNVVLSKTVAATAGSALEFKLAGNVILECVLFYGNNKLFRGITFDRTIAAWVRDSWFQQCLDHAIYVSGTGVDDNRSVDITVHNCRFSNNGNSAVRSYNYTEGLFVQDCVFLSNNNYAIEITPDTPTTGSQGRKNFFLHNNNIEILAADNGIYLDNVSNVEISDTWFGGGGMHIGVGPTADSVFVDACQFTGSASNMISISGNVVHFTGGCDINGGLTAPNGIVLNAGASDIIIDSNTIRQCTSAGVSIASGVNSVICSNNRFKNNPLNVAGMNTLVSAGSGGEYNFGGNVSQTGFVVASAGTITLDPGRDVFQISGTTNIALITESWPGRRVTLIFQDALSVQSTFNIKLSGGVFTTTANDTLTLVCDGPNWYETARSINA